MPGGHSSRKQLSQRRGDLLRILIRHQAEAELRAGPGRQHRLGPFALIAAPEAVDVEGRPGPAAFERREAFFAARRRRRRAAS